MIVFAILGLLIGLLFMFVRQKLSALESRVNLLTDTVQTMAGFSRVEEEEEDETDEESDSEDEEEKGYFTGIAFENVCMEKEDMKVVSDDEVEIELSEVNEITEVKEDVKKIQLEGPDYESLSLKELKDKVSDLGGPKLRTKKELLDFLKNVM
jgi:hypothetical protein